MAIIVINPYQYAAPIGPSADPYSDYVSLLLHGNGTNGSTTFTDSSSYGHTVTPAGDAQISTTQSKFGGASMYFDGSRNPTDYLILPNEANLALLNDDFTVEMWCYLNEYDNELFFWNCNSSAFGGVRIINTSDGTIYLLASTNGTSHTTALGSTATLQLNTWHHIALTKNGSTARVFVDGVIVITTTISSSINNGGINNIGGRSAYPDSMNGYIDDLRITKGVARYTSNFNPPTAELPDPSDPDFDSVSLLLHGDGTNGSTTFIDSSNNSHTVTPAGNAQISTTQSKFGGASMYFDGNGDYLAIGPDSSLSLDSGDFTVEAFIYVTNLSSQISVFASSRAVSSVSDLYWEFSVTSTGQLKFQSRSASQYFARSATSAITVNTWYHVAAVRRNNIITVYVNGVAGPTTVNDGGINLSESYVGVGVFNYPGYVSYFPGYIDDLRITKGVARYTSNFTPPTAPLPDETPPIVTDGLVLHLDAGDSASYPGTGTTWFDLTTNSNDGTITGATYGSADGGSLSFDGNDYVSSFSSQIYGTGSKTVTVWFKVATTSRAGLCGTRPNDGTQKGWVLTVNYTQGGLNYFHTGVAGITVSNVISTNVWYCATATYDSSSNLAALYLNGSQLASQSSFGSSNSSSFNGIIGNEANVGGFDSRPFVGDIAQVSIYNRVLTASEITQNFDALKKRYGL